MAGQSSAFSFQHHTLTSSGMFHDNLMASLVNERGAQESDWAMLRRQLQFHSGFTVPVDT
jgi:hypothetical protein